MASADEVMNWIISKIQGAITTISAFDKKLDEGHAFGINHNFELAAGETGILLLETIDTRVYGKSRRVDIIDIDNQPINVEVATFANVTPDVIGDDISSGIVNLDVDSSNTIDLQGYNETTTIERDVDGNPVGAIELPYGGIIKSERRTGRTVYITEKYILPRNSYLAVEFVNNGAGAVAIEYGATVYQVR